MLKAATYIFCYIHGEKEYFLATLQSLVSVDGNLYRFKEGFFARGWSDSVFSVGTCWRQPAETAQTTSPQSLPLKTGSIDGERG
jgi:hypothetical protein